MTVPSAATRSSAVVDVAPLPAIVSVSRFRGASGVEEVHLTVRLTAAGETAAQWAWLTAAYRQACAALGLDAGTAVFRRVFCSDLVNQAALLDAAPLTLPGEADAPCALSRVCQPPLPPAKFALWAYHLCDSALAKRLEDGWLAIERGPLTHLWTAGLTCPDADGSRAQTDGVLSQYETGLQARGLTLADHVLRTWFFVQHVDANYAGVVAGRKALFDQRSLTADTHYIASTGIGGAAADLRASVMLDAYAVAGVQPAQVRYLAALTHLCPTHRYGVTFERGVAIGYRDRTHALISGTASIDHTGSIVHSGDVLRQLDRTLENIGVLLQDAGAALPDVGAYIVYLRDPADVALVEPRLQQHIGDTPYVIVLAPVCRPGWLIEIECQAAVPAAAPTLPAF